MSLALSALMPRPGSLNSDQVLAIGGGVVALAGAVAFADLLRRPRKSRSKAAKPPVPACGSALEAASVGSSGADADNASVVSSAASIAAPEAIETAAVGAVETAIASPKAIAATVPQLLAICTGAPSTVLTQEQALSVALATCTVPSLAAVLPRIYRNTRIATRHMGAGDFLHPDPSTFKFLPRTPTQIVPVEERLAKAWEIAVPMTESVAVAALAASGVSVDQIGQIVVVSSTGFFGPGLDVELIKRLRLPRNVSRVAVGFMGCAAAANGMAVATDFSVAHPTKASLLVCFEVSSVHATFNDQSVNDAILHAIFADGCAACVVASSSFVPSKHLTRSIPIADDAAPLTVAHAPRPAMRVSILGRHSWLCENAEDGITLGINMNGITCTLSKNLDKYLASNITKYVDDLAAMAGITPKDVAFWAVHPGGTRIIGAVQEGLGLTDDQVADSWAILSEYGNMLSPSILFVMQRVLERVSASSDAALWTDRIGAAFTFSPGVGIEGFLFQFTH